MENKFDTVEGTFSDDIPVREEPKKQSLIKIFAKGLWSENPGLCQLLGLCPLLAVTGTAANALGLGIATIIVVTISSLIISILHRLILQEVRIPLYVVLIATLATVVRLYVEAYFPELYQQLGIYLSLIVTNCIIMGRAEAFAGKNGPITSTLDALGCGIGFSLVLFALGSIREIIGSGTWFMGASRVLGEWAKPLETVFLPDELHFSIAILPPGGFFILALLIVCKRALSLHRIHDRERRLRIDSRRS